MHFYPIKVALCALAATAVSSAPVQAKTATASAHIDQFTYELIDLDLADGITPGISFFGNDELSVNSRYLGDGENEQRIATTGATQVTRSYGATSAVMTNTGVSSTSRLVDPTAPFAVTHQFNSGGHYISNFLLTPGTGLRISALGSLSVDTQGPGTYGRASFGVGAVLSDYPDRSSESVYSGHYYSTEGGSASHRVSAFVYTDDAARIGSFSFSSFAHTQLYTMPAVVPEPATYAMLLAGVAVIGLARRRRRPR